MTRELTRTEGLFVGGSGGAAVAGAIKYAKAHDRAGLKILVFLCDGGNKYVSKIFNDEWMRENGFLDDQPGLGTVRDLLAAKGRQEMVTATTASKVKDVIEQMKRLSISQIPVVERGKLRGIVAEVDLLRHLVTGMKRLDSPIGDLAEGDYATVSPDTKIELVQAALGDARVAIVTDREEVKGIVTKIDLIDFLARQPKSATTPPPAMVKTGKAKAAAPASKKNGKNGAHKAKKAAAPKGKAKARARA
jgi:cystathionine beta-synthase